MTSQPIDQPKPDENQVQVEVRLSAESVAAIDEWRRNRSDRLSRSEVIRQIVEAALSEDSDGTLPPTEQFGRFSR